MTFISPNSQNTTGFLEEEKGKLGGGTAKELKNFLKVPDISRHYQKKDQVKLEKNRKGNQNSTRHIIFASRKNCKASNRLINQSKIKWAVFGFCP